MSSAALPHPRAAAFPCVLTCVQSNRVVEKARVTWNLAEYEAKPHTLSSIRRDLVLKRRWGRQVRACVQGVGAPALPEHHRGVRGGRDP